MTAISKSAIIGQLQLKMHMSNKLKYSVFIAAIFLSFVLIGLAFPTADSAEIKTISYKIDQSPVLIQGNSVLSLSKHFYSLPKPTVNKILVIITGYSSTPQETDNTPYITASGTRVHDGIVAANFLRFGTKIKIPALFGDKVFVVEDRMNPRNQYHVDVWFPSRQAALDFGAHLAYIEITK